MLRARKSILALITALFVVAGFGVASAHQIDGLMTNNGVPLPLDVPAFAGGQSANLDNFVNPGGLGDVLLYNYYNARSGMTTFFTVVNTSTTTGERVRIRFREAADVAVNGVCSPEEPRGSFEVLDFDICLSATDEWSGFIVQNPNDPNGGAMLCTVETGNPVTMDTDTFIYDGSNGADVFPSSCVPFKYGSDNGQALGNIKAEDTLEGYIEIIGERLIDAEPLSCWPDRSAHPTSPDSCVGGTECDVDNVLFGHAALVDSETGATFGYTAVAIADFNNTDITQPPTTSLPTLASGAGDSLVGVNYILTKQRLFAVYDLTNGAGQFVITEPTKALTQVCGAANDIFDDDVASFTVFDDKEHSIRTVCSFSPCPAGTTNHLPFEVNVLSLNNSASVDSKVSQTLLTTLSYGWFTVKFDAPDGTAQASALPHAIAVTNTTNGVTTTTSGWPALGLMLLDVGNGANTAAAHMQYKSNVTSSAVTVDN